MATGTDFGDILTEAIHGGYVAHLTDQTYTIASPIVIFVDSTIQGAMGIDGGGATLISQVTDGSPLIRIVVGPGVDFRYLTLSNFTLQGNGSEGNGIEIIADGNDRWAYNWTISDITVQGVGGYGLDVEGSAFEGLVSNSWMNGNAQGGAYFAHSSNGGVASALRWFGGGAQDNGGVGVTLDNGTRDLGVEGALFANNAGPGISALSGITAVSNSTFEDNLGPGIEFQNYGNFNGNVFSSSGAQTVGIDGFLAGAATLVGNSATSTTLADLQGSGALFLTDNTGEVVDGPNLVPNAMGGDMAQVTPGTTGVALPTLATITAGTTAAKASSTGTGAVESALRAAIAGGFVAHLTEATYTVATPIVINVTSSTQGPVGIDLGGAKIISQIADGSPVIEIIVGPGVDLAGLTLSNFTIWGNGQEGDGIKIVADGPDRSVRDFTISNVNVEHVGGIGLDVLGNVSQGTVFNSWMHGDAEGGARFANSAGGGVVSALEWMGGGVRKNGVAGLILDNGARDLSVTGAYFVDNDGPGLMAPSGITSVRCERLREQSGQRRDRAGLRQLRRRHVRDLRPAGDGDRRLPGGRPGRADRRRQRVLRAGRGSDGACQPAGPGDLGHRRRRQCRGRPERGRDGSADGGNRDVRIDRAGPDHGQLLYRRNDGAGAQLQRRARHGRAVRRVDADRRGTAGRRLRSRLEEGRR